MGKIINLEQSKTLAQKLHQENKRLVVVGGCFDLLHVGHIAFLEEAKKQGDILIVLLESDETIAKNKGSKRPINTQENRAKILAALLVVDYVLALKPNMTDQDYDALVFAIKPAIIATTQGDTNRHYKEHQAQNIGAQVVDVVMPIHNQSTTRLIHLLDEL